MRDQGRSGWLGRFGLSATDDELRARLPGDQLIPDAEVTSTRAITIRRAPDGVWPWIAQLGQRRGGFYSYDWLENLIGCDIHNAESVVPAWQHPQVGDDVQLAPGVPLTVAVLDAGRALVLQGGMPIGEGAPLLDFTWAFSLRAEPNGATRLLVRERYGYGRWWVRFLVAPTALISCVMSRRMLFGIRDRSERQEPAARAMPPNGGNLALRKPAVAGGGPVAKPRTSCGRPPMHSSIAAAILVWSRPTARRDTRR